MTVHVVGGVYRERCIHPAWNEVYGSAGRAALAIATTGTPVVLHAYMDVTAAEVFAEKGAWLDSLQVAPTAMSHSLAFNYLYDLGTPEILHLPGQKLVALTVREDRVVQFGMLEGDAVVHGDWVVYDPQNGRDGRCFRVNGSTANHLAIVLNAAEAGLLAGMPGQHPSICAPALAAKEMAEVVVVKMGPEGAFVWTPSMTTQVPAYKTRRVWKIGSGDCFVAYFANSWMHLGKSPGEAAADASRATGYYCETQGFATLEQLANHPLAPIVLSEAYRNGVRRQVYLAGPFFDLAQIWMVQQARSHLQEFGLKVFSPYHDVGLGTAEDVVAKDLDAIAASDLVLAITDGLDAGTVYETGYARALNKPVIVYSERHRDEHLKMMEGSGCVICDSFATALYATLWEAVRI